MPASITFPKKTGLCVAIILILNIVTGITVICLVLSRQSCCHSSQNDNNDKHIHFKRQLDEIFDSVTKNGFRPSPTTDAKTDNENPSLEFLSLLKPVSQLSGLDFEDKKENPKNRDFRVLRNWANNEGAERNLLWNGMRYEHGSVSVPANGVYKVHSHVKFYVENNKANDTINHFQHEISRYNVFSGQQEPVALNVLSECKEGINDGAHLEYPSDLGCLVKLNSGDQISVKVTHSALLKHDRDWHNFGVYII